MRNKSKRKAIIKFVVVIAILGLIFWIAAARIDEVAKETANEKEVEARRQEVEARLQASNDAERSAQAERQNQIEKESADKRAAFTPLIASYNKIFETADVGIFPIR